MPRARNPLVPLFLTVCLDLVGFGILIPLMPYLALEFGASKSLVTGLNWSYSAAQLVMAPVWGRLSDRVGRRPVLLISIGGSVVSQLLFASTQLWHRHLPPGSGLALLYLARIAAGAFAANFSTAQAYIADVTTPENRAKGMGLLGAAFGVGFVLGPALGGFLDRFGHAVPLLVAATLSAANLVSATLSLPETRHESPPVPREGRLAALRRGFASSLAPLLVLQLTIVFAFANMESTLALVVFERFGWRAPQVGRLFAFSGVVIIALQGGLTGRLARRFGERALLLSGMLLEAAGMVAVPFVSAPVGITATLGVLAAGSGLCTPSLSSLLSRRAAASEQGGTLGLAASLGSLGRIAGPMWGGWSYDQFHYQAPYLSAAAVLLASFLYGLIALRTPKGASSVVPSGGMGGLPSRVMRRLLILLGPSLVAACEAPRASEVPPPPEPPAQIAPPAETPAAVAPTPAVDPVQRARIEQMLTGYGYVPDAATLKALGRGAFEALSSIADNDEAQLEVRARALASLSYLDDPRVPAELTLALQMAQNPLLVRTALFGLARVRGNASVPQIAPFLSDRNPTLRLASAEALGRVGGAAARRALQQRLEGETDPAVRDALARALTKSNP